MLDFFLLNWYNLFVFFSDHIQLQIDIATTLIELQHKVNTYKAMSYTVLHCTSISIKQFFLWLSRRNCLLHLEPARVLLSLFHY